MGMLRETEPQILVIDNTRTEHVSLTTTVHEHRAPTDESVRLLKEMEEKAERKLVESIHVGDTLVECVIHVWQDHASDCTRVRAVFKINGKQETAEHEFRPSREYRGQQVIDANVWRAVQTKISDVIANRMLMAEIPAFLKGR